MTKEEIEKRLENYSTIEEKIDCIDEWKWELDMQETWSTSTRFLYSLLTVVRNDLVREKEIHEQIDQLLDLYEDYYLSSNEVYKIYNFNGKEYKIPEKNYNFICEIVEKIEAKR